MSPHPPKLPTLSVERLLADLKKLTASPSILPSSSQDSSSSTVPSSLPSSSAETLNLYAQYLSTNESSIQSLKELTEFEKEIKQVRKELGDVVRFVGVASLQE